jgi:tRNA threonylcarbamoyladenosine biosynthesis protein TsaE
MRQTLTVSTLEDLSAWAKQLATQLQLGMVVTLTGELGVGKTTFVQYLAKHLGYTGYVHSPSFSLIHVYPLLTGRIVHVDAYRLQPNSAELGLDDLTGTDTLMMIEWPDHLRSLPEGKRVAITMTMTDDHARQVIIESDEPLII